MDDRDRLRAYLVIKDLTFCTAAEVAAMTGLPRHDVERILGELVGENKATEEGLGRTGSYRINSFQKEAVGRKAAELMLRLRGAPNQGS